MGGGVVNAVTARGGGGGRDVATFGNLPAGPPTGAGATATATATAGGTAGGRREGATFNGPSPGPPTAQANTVPTRAGGAAAAGAVADLASLFNRAVTIEPNPVDNMEEYLC